MEINLFWNSTFVIALSQGLFVTIILFSQYLKTRHLSQLVLGAFLFVFSSILLNNLVYWNQLFGTYPQLIFSTASTRFLLAPLFFIYCQTFIKKSIGRKYLFHFLPFILITLLYSPVLFLSGSEKLSIITTGIGKTESLYFGLSILVNWFLAFHLIAYSLLIFYQLNQYLKSEDKPVNKNKLSQINWLKFLNGLFLIYGLLMLIYFILVSLQIGGIEKDYYISLIMCIALYSISYTGMVNPDLLKGEKFLQKIQDLKYRKTSLKEDYLIEIITQLEELIQLEKLHLDPEVNLNLIAKKLNLPRHHISQALSLKLDKTFPEYINAHRIEHALQMLQNLPEGKNIKTVMYASGFNNRASFNNNFKKITGKTASEFIKDSQNSSSER